MGKALGSWSGMRKYLEKEMLAPSLEGRIRYNCTRYVGMDNCFIFEIFADKKLAKQFSWETVNTYFINNGYKQNRNPMGTQEYWAGFWDLLDKIPLGSRDEYLDEEFCDALKTYRSQSIQESLMSENPIEKLFAILDYRVGKRTLIEFGDTVGNQPTWLQFFYKLRLDAENIKPANGKL